MLKISEVRRLFFQREDVLFKMYVVEEVGRYVTGLTSDRSVCNFSMCVN